MQDQIGRRFAQIGQHRFEGSPIAVDIGDDGDPHLGLCGLNCVRSLTGQANITQAPTFET